MVTQIDGDELCRSGSRPLRVGAVRYRVAGRLFTIILGLASIAWGVANFPILWRQSVIERTAAAVLNRDTFKPGALEGVIPAVDAIENSGYCRPAALHSAAIIRMRLAEGALVTGQRKAIDARLDSAERGIRLSLSCAPSDAFLWLALAWLDELRVGFQPQQLTYLRQSYRLGPNEGWIAARRNRVALSMFARLPPDLAERAVTEFDRLLDSWIYWDAIAIFEGPGWPIRDRLLASLKAVGQRQRQAFADALYAQGYDLAVPGVEARKPRPWY
jgi:hypothetical protein